MATRATLRTRARTRADQDNSKFPTDAQYNLFLDEAAKDVWYDLVQAGWPIDPEDWVIDLDGSESYNLGTPRTMASAPLYTGQVAFVDDGSDPADKNGWGYWVENHSTPGSDLIIITFDVPNREFIISFRTGVVGGIRASWLAEAVNATGLLETIGDFPSNAILDITPTPFDYQEVFSGGTVGSDPVAFVHGVWRRDGSGLYALKRLNEGQRVTAESVTGGMAETYSLGSAHDGMRIRVYPRQASGSVLTRVIREYPGFVTDASRWMGPARSDELIVLRAAAKGCRKEGNDQAAAQLDREYDVVLSKVQNMASWVDMRNPPTIADVSSPSRRDPSDWDLGLIRF
jgi:hypothetical protein